jgi:hypothetical protein
MEHNQNPFATAEAAWPSPSPATSSLPCAVEAGEPDALAFDPVAVAPRMDGWTPERQRAFIEELADCGIVSEAAGRVGMTARSAHRLRRRPDAEAFNLAWEAALRLGVDHLRSVAYERAIVGTPRFYRGEKVGEERIYDNRLLIYLLGRQQKAPNLGGVHAGIREWSRWMEAIEEGVPKPMRLPDEAEDSPVWEAKDGSWWTSFPPPPGYEGEQIAATDEDEYRRRLAPDELDAVRAWLKSDAGEQARRRDAYFTRMKRNFSTPR